MYVESLNDNQTKIRIENFSNEEYEKFLEIKALPAYSVHKNEIVVNNEFLRLIGLENGNGKKEINFHLSDFLFDYQKFIVKLALIKRRFAIFAAVGLGKTNCMLEWSEHVREWIPNNSKILIVSPLMVINQTINEQNKFYGKKEFINCHSVGFDRWIKSSERFGIVNYDLFRKPINFDGKIGAILLDESGSLKHEQSVIRTNVINAAKGIGYKLCCTATPAPNDKEEYANHSYFLEYIRSYQEFFSKFFMIRDDKWMLKPHATEAFYKHLATFSIFLRNPVSYGFEDNLKDIKTPIVNTIKIELTEEQKQFIGQKTNRKAGFFDSAVEIGGIVDRNKFSQISKGFLYTDNGTKRIESNKGRVIYDLVEKHKDEQIIIWTQYDEEGEHIYSFLKDEFSVSLLTGKTNEKNRIQIIQDFLDGKIRILISKARLLGFGLNFQNVSVVIYSGLSDCYDIETQILTKNGWKHYNEIDYEDDIGTLNPDSHLFEWQKPISIICEHYSGTMHHYESYSGFDLLVTPNHKLYLQRCPIRYSYNNNGEFKLIKSKEVFNKCKKQEYRMAMSASNWNGDRPDYIYIPKLISRMSKNRISKIATKDFVKFLGWYISEGYLGPSKDGAVSGKIVISQSLDRITLRDEIIECIRNLGCRHVNTTTKDIFFSDINLAKFLEIEFGRKSKNLFLPKWFKNLDKEYLELFIETILKGDGHRRVFKQSNKKFDSYKTYSIRLLDDLQEVCIKIGISSKIDYKFFNIYFRHWKKSPHILNIGNKEIEYNDKIWCVTVPNHIVVVRRNGKACISGNSYEAFHQSLGRVHRYGNNKQIYVYIPVTVYEEVILKNVLRKKNMFEHDAAYQENLYKEQLLDDLFEFAEKGCDVTREVKKKKGHVEEGENWKLILGDNIKVLDTLDENSIHFCIFSPPFADLFTYSSDIADMGNCNENDDDFTLNYQFFAKKLLRVMMPGRKVCVHVAQLPILKSATGYIGMKDFRGLIIEAMSKSGFYVKGEVAIKKNQQMQSIVKHAPGLAMGVFEKDSNRCLPCFNDYFLIFEKPGENDIPVTPFINGEMTRDDWIKVASGCWMINEEVCDIKESDTLNTRRAKTEEDEKHICPLQLEPIRRFVKLYSNPGETVLDPFSGIGSTGYIAMETGRKYVGIELKEEYFRESVKNVSGKVQSSSVWRKKGLLK